MYIEDNFKYLLYECSFPSKTIFEGIISEDLGKYYRLLSILSAFLRRMSKTSDQTPDLIDSITAG